MSSDQSDRHSEALPDNILGSPAKQLSHSVNSSEEDEVKDGIDHEVK